VSTAIRTGGLGHEPVQTLTLGFGISAGNLGRLQTVRDGVH
jgi:hypothetical protein